MGARLGSIGIDVGQALAETKAAQFDTPVLIQQQVGRLQVPVDHCLRGSTRLLSQLPFLHFHPAQVSGQDSAGTAVRIRLQDSTLRGLLQDPDCSCECLTRASKLPLGSTPDHIA